MSRLPPLSLEAMDAQQRQLHERIASGPRGRVRGPLAAWLYSAPFAQTVHPMGEYLRYRSLLAGRLAELAILVVARHWHAQYEWFVHAPLALKAGIAPAVVDAIGSGRPPAFEQADEACVWQVCTGLLQDRHVPAQAYARAVEVLGEARLVELTGLIGYYSLGAFTLNLFEIEPPPGEEPRLPPL